MLFIDAILSKNQMYKDKNNILLSKYICTSFY